jgi:hypothetical protein
MGKPNTDTAVFLGREKSGQDKSFIRVDSCPFAVEFLGYLGSDPVICVNLRSSVVGLFLRLPG